MKWFIKLKYNSDIEIRIDSDNKKEPYVNVFNVTYNFDNIQEFETNIESEFYSYLAKSYKKGFYFIKNSDKYLIDEGTKKYPEFFI